MRYFLITLILYLPTVLHADLYVGIVQGLAGEEKYRERFTEQANKLAEFSTALAGEDKVRFFDEDSADRDAILQWLNQINSDSDDNDRLALFLIGHGSYDGYQYKFNIQGPDLTDEDLLKVLNESPAQFQLLVNTSSSSGALLKSLESESRILITATKSGAERNATRFGAYLLAGLESSTADINKNDAISAKEAFDYAERMTADFYESEGRLATEHPQLLGDQAGQFTLARLSSSIDPGSNSELANLLEQKNQLDIDIEDLQLSKSLYSPEDYLDELQTLLIELAMTQERIDNLRDAQ